VIFQVLVEVSVQMSSAMLRSVVWQKLTDLLEVVTASIIRTVIVAIIVGEMTVSKRLWNVGNFYVTTRCNIAVDSRLQMFNFCTDQ
jgi:hypothetical protein